MQVPHAVPGQPAGEVHVGLHIGQARIPDRAEDRIAPVQARLARPGDGPPAPVLLEEIQDVVQLVCRLEAQHERGIAAPLQDHCGRDGCFQAMRGPGGNHAPKRAERVLGFLPVIGEGIEKALNLLRGPWAPMPGHAAKRLLKGASPLLRSGGGLTAGASAAAAWVTAKHRASATAAGSSINALSSPSAFPLLWRSLWRPRSDT